MSCRACKSSGIRPYALPRTTCSEGGRKLPRTVRVSYRLNGLPAGPAADLFTIVEIYVREVYNSHYMYVQCGGRASPRS